MSTRRRTFQIISTGILVIPVAYHIKNQLTNHPLSNIHQKNEGNRQYGREYGDDEQKYGFSFRDLLSKLSFTSNHSFIQNESIEYKKTKNVNDGQQGKGNGLPTVSRLLSRKEMLEKLKETPEYDLLVIGGGATGAGCALDAASRGLNVALVERDDFSSGTSSRSTKLVHGGVRYLEKAFLNLDYEQYKLVREALFERGSFLTIAPYLAYQLPIMLPIYEWWKVPYYWVGSKVYDILAGSHGLTQSSFLTAYEALNKFPMLRSKDLCGAIVYYDGAQNDSRMNVALAATAASLGATIANHVEVIELIKDETTKKLCGAIVKDILSGETWPVRCKGIVNATGPFTDAIRKLDNPKTETIVSPSSGVHLILPKYFCPHDMGLIDPSTSDGRVVFFLPWEGTVIAGTTDAPTTIDANPKPTKSEIDWIVSELSKHLEEDIEVRHEDILAAWTGIRPLVRNPSASNTEALVRNHMIDISESGLLTIAGGKWTTYRAMAQETIDTACYEYKLNPEGPCTTSALKLIGSENWHRNFTIELTQKYKLDPDIAEHLSRSYGAQAHVILNQFPYLDKTEGKVNLLSKKYPYLEAEVLYACDYELASTAVDVLARRTRLAFLDAKEAWKCTHRVVDLMADKFDWNQKRKEEEVENTRKFLLTMGLEL